MSTETLAVIFISSLITVVIAVIGFLLKGYLKGVKSQLEDQNESMKTLLTSFQKFEIELVKIEGALSNIKTKQSEASSNIKETKTLAFSNQERITKHGHDISNLKHNYLEYHKLVIDNAEEIKKINSEILIYKAKEKAGR